MTTPAKIVDNACGEISWKDDNGKNHFANFAKHNDTWAMSHGLEYVILFPNTQEVRYAKILKTVMHVATCENDFGGPITESWKAKAKFY